MKDSELIKKASFLTEIILKIILGAAIPGGNVIAEVIGNTALDQYIKKVTDQALEYNDDMFKERTRIIKAEIKEGHIDRKDQELYTAALDIYIDKLPVFLYESDLDNIISDIVEEYIHEQGIISEDRIHLLNENLPCLIQKLSETLPEEIHNDPEIEESWRKNTQRYILENRESIRELQQKYCLTEKRIDLIEFEVNNLRPRVDKLEQIVVESSNRKSDKNKKQGRTRYFEELWDNPLFLDDDLIFGDLYQVPTCNNGEDKVDEVLLSTLEKSDVYDQRALLILGHPGYGKSASIIWMLNHMPPDTERIIKTKCFRDFNASDWQGDTIQTIFEKMLEKIGVKDEDYSCLNNTVLILDGLDEINLNGDEKMIAKKFYTLSQNKDIEKFNLFITCRLNRFMDDSGIQLSKKDIPYITIDPFGNTEIKHFVNDFLENKKEPEEYKDVADSILSFITIGPFGNTKIKYFVNDFLENKKEPEEYKDVADLILSFVRLDELKKDLAVVDNVLQIPLILYMVLSLKIEISQSKGIVDIYNEIFSTTKGNSVYRKAKYYSESEPHKITDTEVIKIHEFSKKIAMDMWKNEPDQAVIPRERYDNIRKLCKIEELTDLLIGQYLSYIEGKKSFELYFVHRSMYQYFVALSIFDSIKNMMSRGNPEEQFRQLKKECYENIKKCHENNDSPIICFARIIGEDIIYSDSDIAQFLSDMLNNSEILKDDWLKEFLACFLDSGLTRFVDSYEESSMNCLKKEVKRFYNLIWLTREQLSKIDPSASHYKVANVNESFCFYLRQRKENRVDLQQIDLSNADLNNADLSRADLSRADLSNTRLSRADLSRADLSNARLSRADLSRADLSNADLSNADLSNARLSRADLSNANLSRANLSNASLRKTDLSNVNLSRANLNRANLIEADLKFADLSNANLSNANLSNANLIVADLSNANLTSTDLRGANLTSAHHSGK